MATKSNETVNGRYFFRWNSPEGQAALKAANIALKSTGLQIYYDTGMAPGLVGDLVPDVHTDMHQQTVAQAARVEQEEEQRQKEVAERIRQAEAAAAERAKKTNE